MSYYRTRLYLAGDWDGDHELIQKLIRWNESEYWNLSFSDAHKIMQARDDSLPCSIKKSLLTRMNASKTFVLVVGDKTNIVTKGACRYCNNYNSCNGFCKKGYWVDQRSFINYECAKAVLHDLKIIVIYNSYKVERSKCPEAVRYSGKHIPAYYYTEDGMKIWSYSRIKELIEE